MNKNASDKAIFFLLKKKSVKINNGVRITSNHIKGNNLMFSIIASKRVIGRPFISDEVVLTVTWLITASIVDVPAKITANIHLQTHAPA
jgi:hypothetical protein